MIDNLKSGLTLVAYDVKSDVACCLALQGKSLERVSMTFILKHDDYPGDAKKLIEQGQHVIRISRIGSVCTGVSVIKYQRTHSGSNKQRHRLIGGGCPSNHQL